MWAENSSIIISVVGAFTAVLMYFQFILVPLTTAYFFLFLATPIINLCEFRPINCKVRDPSQC